MRKATFLNFPTHGCINSLLATAAELVSRGEKVIYYCTSEFREKIERTGAEFRPYKGLINTFRLEDNDLFKGMLLNIDMTLDKLEYNLNRIRADRPDYIVHDSLCTWGKHIAAILKLPAINLMHSFPVTRASTAPGVDTVPLLMKVALYKLKNAFRRDGPEKVLKRMYNIDLSLSDVLINREALNIVYTSGHMEPYIYRSEKTYRFVGPSLFFKEEKDDFPYDKLKGQKVIYISLGTLHNDNVRFYETCVEAFIHSGYHVVMSVGFAVDSNTFSNLPSNITIRQSVPQQRLLEQVDVFITHAGMNSVNEAVCCGVPMLLLPHQFEQKMIARRVNTLGLGIRMNINSLTPSKLLKNTVRLLGDSRYQRQAKIYAPLFKKEEAVSHLKAADEILHYVGARC